MVTMSYWLLSEAELRTKPVPKQELGNQEKIVSSEQ